MVSQGAPGTQWMPKLTLENYLNLEHMDTISPDLLRKILSMHGFKSVNVPQDDLLDAVRSIELMDVHHSTLQSDVISSNAFLSISDVTRDLSVLHWQECCITHIETINSVTNFVEESSPKRLKPNSNTVVNESDTSGLQKEMMDQNPTIGHTEAKRSDQKEIMDQNPMGHTEAKTGDQKEIMDQNPTMGHTEAKRSDQKEVMDQNSTTGHTEAKMGDQKEIMDQNPTTGHTEAKRSDQKEIMDQSSTMGHTESKRSDRVKKVPTKLKDFE